MTKTVKDLNAKIDKLEDTVKNLQEMLETLINTKIIELEQGCKKIGTAGLPVLRKVKVQ